MMLLQTTIPRHFATYSRCDLVALLGSYDATGFTDSSDGREEMHLYWRCGCRATRDRYVADTWRHEPCALEHLV